MTGTWVLGTMSGTSLDGVDAACLRTDGVDIFEFGPHAYRPYAAKERRQLQKVLGCWPDDPGVAEAAEMIERAHAQLITDLPGDLVGFHGQTLAHEPEGRGTHQACDGARLAQAIGRPVVWDFRTADVTLGGQGAPLAPAFHFACARWIGATKPVAFLNLGGVGNLTWVDPTADTMGQGLLAFDTGPANAPLNDLVQASGLGDYDANGALAAQGQVDRDALQAALARPYYARIPPKSLDRDVLSPNLQTLNPADAAATLVALIAETVWLGVQHCPQIPHDLLVTGGGRKNPTIMAALKARLSLSVRPVEEVGLDGDMLEAQAFGYLALRVKRGLPTSFPSTTGVRAAVGGGQISQPGLDSA